MKSAGQKDDQAFLEEDVLGVNYESFTQIAVLGNAAYTPFMQLKTPQRREFIEHILDIGVFSTMNDILKTKQTGIKTALESLTKDIDLQKEKVKLVEGFIEKLEAEQRKVKVDTDAQIEAQNAIIDARMPDIERLTAEIETENESLTTQTNELNATLTAEIEEINTVFETKVESLDETIIDVSPVESKIAKLTHMRQGINDNARATQQNIDFYSDTDACKTCKQNIHEDFRVKILSEKTKQLAEFKTGLEKITAEIEKYTKKLQEHKAANVAVEVELRKLRSENQMTIREVSSTNQITVRKITAEMQAKIKVLTTELQGHEAAVSAARQFIKKMLADKNSTSAAANIQEQYQKRDDLTEKSTSLESKKEYAIETRHFYEIAAVLLKDTGIKAAIIKQYLPMINKLVNKYLAELDFYLLFALDENFDETFKSRHRDTLQYHSFSEGEKLRIDLSLLFAWRDIARMKNSCATNLLILDEVIDGSMDHNGTDFFIKMINELGTGSNVFVISHKQDSSLDKFKDVLRFEKIKGFSQLAISV